MNPNDNQINPHTFMTYASIICYFCHEAEGKLPANAFASWIVYH